MQALPVWPEHMAQFESLLKGIVDEFLKRRRMPDTPEAVYSLGLPPNRIHVMTDGTYRLEKEFTSQPTNQLPAVGLTEVAPDKKALIKILDGASVVWAYRKARRTWEAGGKVDPFDAQVEQNMHALRTAVYDSLQ